MRLLDLVKQHHRIGHAAHRLGQLAAFVVPDIAGRRTDHARYGILFHVFRHVDAHHRAFVPEHGLGQRLAQLGLAHAGRTEEEKGTDGTVRVLEPRARPADGTGDGADRLLLPDNALMQRILQAQQARGLILRELGNGNVRPGGDDLRDLLGAHLLLHGGTPRLPGLALRGHVGLLRALLVAQTRRAFKVLVRDGLFLFLFERRTPLLRLLHVRRGDVGPDAHARGRLVDQVDGLVRQVAIGDVAVGQLHRRLDGLVGDAHLVVRLVPVAQPLEDLHGLLAAGLAHGDGLEPAFQRRILLDVLAVLVQRRRADALDLSARQGGL